MSDTLTLDILTIETKTAVMDDRILLERFQAQYARFRLTTVQAAAFAGVSEPTIRRLVNGVAPTRRSTRVRIERFLTKASRVREAADLEVAL